MSFVALEQILGDLPLQAHAFGPKIKLQDRDTVYACRMLARQTEAGQEAHFTHDPEARGDITSGVFFQTADVGKRDIGAWRFGAWPCLAEEGEAKAKTKKMLPVFNDYWKPDARFEKLEVHPAQDRPKIPGGAHVLVLDAQKEDEQIPLPFVCDTYLVAQWRGLDFNDYSNRVYDIDGNGDLDDARNAPLDVHLRVSGLPQASGSVGFAERAPYALAWNLDVAPGGESYGLCYGTSVTASWPPPPAPPPTKPRAQGSAGVDFTPKDKGPGLSLSSGKAVLASFGTMGGGPLYVGDYDDPHRRGINRDGEPVNAGAIGINALFHASGGVVAPLEFRPKEGYPGGLIFQNTVEVRLVYDARTTHPWIDGGEVKTAPGLWRWYSFTPWKGPVPGDPSGSEGDPSGGGDGGNLGGGGGGGGGGADNGDSDFELWGDDFNAGPKGKGKPRRQQGVFDVSGGAAHAIAAQQNRNAKNRAATAATRPTSRGRVTGRGGGINPFANDPGGLDPESEEGKKHARELAAQALSRSKSGRAGDQKQGVAAVTTTNEVGVAASCSIATPPWWESDQPDLRYAVTADPDQRKKAAGPVVLREDNFGAFEAGQWVYTSAPTIARYKDGTASGGKCAFPPELDLNDIRDGSDTNVVGAVSSTYSLECLVTTGKCLGVDPVAATPHTAVVESQDADTGAVTTTAIDAAGAESAAYSVTLAGVVRFGQATEHPIGTDTGGGPITLGTGDHSVLVDNTSGGTYTLNLPSSNASSKGRVYQIKRLNAGGATRQIAITCQGGETIEGGGPLNLEAQYDSVVVKSDGAGGWWTF